MEIRVPAQTVPVLADADVVVCGGGCAGVTAALSAARHGASVILIERWPTVGGMATNAMVNCWHRSDREKVVINGLVEECARRAEQGGWIVKDPQFPAAHETHWFDPEGMRIVWQRMLREAGVRVLCYTVAGEPLVENGRLCAVLCDTKRGRRAVSGRVFVDATGDGDIAAKAGVDFDFGRSGDGRVQGMTQMFTLRGLDARVVAGLDWPDVDRVMNIMRRLRDEGRFPQFNDGNIRASLYLDTRDFRKPFYWNVCPAAGDPLDEEELSRLTAGARESIVKYIELWRAEMPGYAAAAIAQTGFAMGVRESRRIGGLKTLDAPMVLGAVKQPDAIGHGVWMIDIHDPLGTGYTTYSDRDKAGMLRPGTSYHIPLGMCLNGQVPNLAVAGRCASATHEAHGSVRVQTHCMVMGQGAGTCAALSLETGCDPRRVGLSALQSKLRADGVYLEDVPPSDLRSLGQAAAEGGNAPG